MMHLLWIIPMVLTCAIWFGLFTHAVLTTVRGRP